MRSNVTLDARVLHELQSATASRTKAKAVLIAIEDYLRRRKVREIKQFKGKLRFAPDTWSYRHHDR